MTREDSRRRAERAHRLRSLGRTWQEVADSEGYRSRRAAQLAVQRLHAAEPGETAEEVRRSASDTLRITRSILLGRVADATKRGDDQTLVTLAREVHRNLDQWAKLIGVRAHNAGRQRPRRADPAAILDRMESELLALVEQRQQPPVHLGGNVIEGEVVE